MNERRPDAATYARVFEGHHEGALILEDLVRRFYDVPLWVRGGPEAQREMERRVANREVVHFILGQLGQVRNEATDTNADSAG
jgi:hypothetical protein